MRRKLLALLLVLTMMISILPLATFAEENDGEMPSQSVPANENVGTPAGVPVVSVDDEPTVTTDREPAGGEPVVPADGDPAVAPKEETESCKHEHTHWTVLNQHEHAKACDDCHLVLGDQGSHNMVDGTCTICGYHACEDGHTWGNDGYLKHVCLVCGYVTDHKLGAGCVCEICGEISHPGYIVSPLDESYCKWICTECGAEERHPHNDENGDGICDVCGYKINGTIDPTEPKPTEPSKGKGLDSVPKTDDLSVIVAGLAALVFGMTATVLKKFVL